MTNDADAVNPKPGLAVGKAVQVSDGDFLKFNPSLLGLGSLNTPSASHDVICAVFDLERFTFFGTQIEPHLALPGYMEKFLSWIFEELRDEMVNHEKTAEKAIPSTKWLYAPLPFFVKFLGDGLLVLWDIGRAGPTVKRNIVISCSNICDDYEDTFVPSITNRFVNVPPRLRCGIAMGKVFSVGEQRDFVGSCINMAARLEKLPGVYFAFNIRGFDIDSPADNSFFREFVEVKQVSIRGIGENELIAIQSVDLGLMSPADRKLYRDV